MKNVLKKVLCAVMMLSLIMTAMPVTFAAEELVLFDARFDSLADGAKTSLTSDDFTHVKYDYSNGTATNGNTEVTNLNQVSIGSNVTTTIANAGNGKSGKAFFYNVTDATAKQETKHDFRWAPTVKATDSYGREDMKVTYEFSLRAPENTGNGYQQFDYQVPIDGGARTVVSLQAKTNGVKAIYAYDKTNNGTWQTICNWEDGKWYNISVVFTPGTNKIDYYLTGILVREAIHSATYTTVGGRFRLIHTVPTINANSTYTDTFAIDDIRIFIGTPDTAKYSTEITSASYAVSGNAISLGCASVDRDTFISGVSVANGGSVEVYTDSTCSAVAQTVTEGCVAVATSANGSVIAAYSIVEKETILGCDMENSVGIAENAVPLYEGNLVGSNGTGNGSIGFAGEFATYAKGNVKSAGAGKDGYAYFFDVNNETEALGAPALDFKFLPEVKAGKVTFEFSMLAPESYDTIRPALYVPYNGKYKVLFELAPDGKLGMNGAYIRQWVPGRWYNFAVEFTLGSANADFYLNGDLVLDDAEVYTNLNPDGVIGMVGSRMRFEVQAGAGISDVTAFDDVKVYTSGYDAAANAVEFESNSENYDISEFGYIFALDSPVRVNTLKTYISGNFTVYEDDTFETTASYTGEGNVFVAASENGNIVKYYTLVPDGTIAVTVNDSATTKLSSRNTVTIGAMARCENAYVFAAAYDAEGNFKGADLVSAIGATDNPASVSFNTNAGDIVKLMLWDKATLKPVGDMVTIQKQR